MRAWLALGCLTAIAPLLVACPTAGTAYECDGGPCDDTAAADPPRIYVNPPFGLGFDCVLMGCMQTQSFTVRNNGTGTVRVQRVTLTSTSSEDFEIVSDRPRPLDITKEVPGTFGVRYVPSDGEADVGSVRITYTLDPPQGPDPEPVELPLRTRTLGSAKAEVEGEELNFGYVAPGEVLSKELVVHNVSQSGSVLVISDAQFEEDSDAAFRVITEMPLYANNGESVRIAVRFAPPLDQSSARTFRGVLHLSTNDGAQPDLAVGVIGTARQAPQLLVEPETYGNVLDIGSIGVGEQTETTLYVRNVGGSDLVVVPSIINGQGSGFTTEPSVGQLPAVAPFDRTQLIVRYVAGEGGPAVGPAGAEPTLRLQTNDPQQPTVNIRLKGFGVLPNLQPSAARIDFGGTVTGWMLEPRTISVRNTGAGPLNITDAFLELGSDSQFRLAAVSGLPTTLLPEDPPLEVTVHFAPVTLGTANGVLVFASDDPDEPLKRVPLTGRGMSCAEGCPLPHATPSCITGVCKIDTCESRYHDADEKDITGCECREDDGGDIGHVCGGGERNLGTCSDDGCDRSYQGSLHGGTDQDTFWFYAEDAGPISQLFGDDYDVRIDLSGPSGLEYCLRYDGHDVQGQGCGRGGEECGRRSFRKEGSWGSDDDRDFTIRVRFTPGTAPFCANYTLRIRNG